MPSRNRVKDYVADNYYHVYNRGVDKREIFLDEQDYGVFLSYLKVALSPKDEIENDNLSHMVRKRLRRKNLNGQVDLLAYCLMPNHFHLLFYQHTDRGIAKLMRSIMTGYAMYFNRRYERTGPLFQGRYKASLIDNEAYLWHISRYIHLNPKNWQGYQYSSYPYYSQDKNANWVKPDKILELHSGSPASYKQFLKDHSDYRESFKEIKPQLANT